MKLKRYVLVSMIFILLINFFSQGGWALTTSTVNREDNYRIFINKLDENIPRLLKKYRVPGTAIGIIHNGEISWMKGYGIGNKRESTKVETDTVFQVASISKTVTAWGVMKLVEEGKLQLDAPISQYLTRWELPDSEYNDEVTVRGLLSHTAGLSVGGYAGYRDVEGLDIVNSLAGDTYRGYRVYIQREPRRRFQYSGGGYSLLQLLVEEVTGLPFEEYMKKEVLLPLGMKNSSFVLTPEIEANLAKPYGVFGETLHNYLFVERAAAGLYTTAEDLTTFLLASMEDAFGNKAGANLLKEETIEKMLTKTRLKNGSAINYGLGYYIGQLPNKNKVILHGGDNIGWRSLILGNPSKGEGMVILTNSYRGNHLINELEAYWEEYQTGVEATFIRDIKATEGKIKMLAIGALLIFFVAIGRLLIHIKLGKRKFLLKETRKHKWLKWLQVSFGLLIILAWWIGLYAPWYQNGWTIAAFLPLGFGWITPVVTIIGLYITLSALFPKMKVSKIKVTPNRMMEKITKKE